MKPYKWKKEISYKEYCEKNPVRYNEYGNMKDPSGSVGEYPDQYETLQAFVNDVWMRYRPWGGKCFYEKMRIFGMTDRKKLVSKDPNSKFFEEVADNRYVTNDRYSDLKQHY